MPPVLRDAADRGVRGTIVSFGSDPFDTPPEAALAVERDGLLVISKGRIAEMGPTSQLIARHPGLAVEDHSGCIISAGFVDAHVHYPQSGIIASWGKQLVDWLERYTFPAELELADPERACTAAELYLDLATAQGITTASVYCTSHRHSVDVLFEAAERRGLRIVAGKVLMDRNAPKGLLDTVQSGVDDSAALIERWHGRGRASYAISPRFAPTSSPAQLEAAGALWRAHPGCGLQTHYAESPGEIDWVRRLFPDAADYLDVYERAGLIGPGSNLGHAIHLSPRERQALRASGGGISHCPTSNLFLGSGLFDPRLLLDPQLRVPVGLGTDVGGGSSFSMLATMKAAYEVAQLGAASLHPAQLLYLATAGGARLLRLDDRIGNIRAGMEADLVVLDPHATPVLSQRTARATSLADTLFALIMLGDDRAVRAVYADGRRLETRRPDCRPERDQDPANPATR